MRASTLFGLTLAALLGLGVVVGAKALGLFDGEAVVEKKETPIKVLVAKRPLFKSVTLSSADVEVRTLTDAERGFYKHNLDKLLPPLAHAVDYRVLARNVGPNQILVEEYFEPAAFPEAVTERLDPGMRAVHLTLPRDRAEGGILRVGERVDVLLTTSITPDSKQLKPFAATASIARNLKIIVKRDNLWTVMKTDPENKPTAITLQANPYRAALIEYAKLKGIVTLVSAAPAMMAKGDKEPSQNDPDNKEYRDEEKRVSEFLNHEHIVSDGDLERIFNLRLLPVPAPPPRVRVEMLTGAKFRETATFQGGFHQKELPGRPRRTDVFPEDIEAEPTGFHFGAPDARSLAAIATGKDCPTCGKK